MKKFCYSFLYAGVLGTLSTLLARLIPREFDPNAFPFRPFDFEQQGKFYEKLGVRTWKDSLPDLSRVLKFLPRKQVTTRSGAEGIRCMVQETCVAELVHVALIALTLPIVKIWSGIGGWLFWLAYNLVGNLPYIIIQRYNRPRLLRLANKLEQKTV